MLPDDVMHSGREMQDLWRTGSRVQLPV